VRDVVGNLATIHADEGSGWNDLHAGWDTHRVNHSVRFMDKGVCTNQAAMVGAALMAGGVSRKWAGYWQRAA
jgi:hypothetical protein